VRTIERLPVQASLLDKCDVTIEEAILT